MVSSLHKQENRSAFCEIEENFGYTEQSLSLSDIEAQKALEQINPKLYLAIVAKYFKVQKW